MISKRLILWCRLSVLSAIAAYLCILSVVYLQAKGLGLKLAASPGEVAASLHEMWVGILLMCGVVFVCACMASLAWRVVRGKVFTSKNEKELVWGGFFSAICGAASVILSLYYGMQPFSFYGSVLLVLVGILLVFFSLILKIGKKLQQEQFLTI